MNPRPKTLSILVRLPLRSDGHGLQGTAQNPGKYVELSNFLTPGATGKTLETQHTLGFKRSHACSTLAFTTASPHDLSTKIPKRIQLSSFSIFILEKQVDTLLVHCCLTFSDGVAPTFEERTEADVSEGGGTSSIPSPKAFTIPRCLQWSGPQSPYWGRSITASTSMGSCCRHKMKEEPAARQQPKCRRRRTGYEVANTVCDVLPPHTL